MARRWLAAAALAALMAASSAAQEALVTVNGEPITREALIHRVLDLSRVGLEQLEEMVNEALLFQEAQKRGIAVSDAEIGARVGEIKAKLQTEEAFRAYLNDQQVTEAGLRHKLRVKMLVERMLGDKAAVTEEEVRNYYETRKPLFGRPETVTVRMILAKSKERADEVMRRLAANEDFAAVARALSEHKYTAERGGLVERPLSRANLVSQALADAVFATQVGSFTQPIETPDGYYIVKVEQHQAAASESFDDVKEAIRASIQEAKLQDAWVAWLKEARDRASVERRWHP